MFLSLKVRGVYYTQELNINFLSGYMYNYIKDTIIESKL